MPAAMAIVASVPIHADGMCHVAAIENGEDVRLTNDYFIESMKDNPPEVKITRPGRDFRATPIEEVTIAVEAKDDFGLRSVDLALFGERRSRQSGPHAAIQGSQDRQRLDADFAGRFQDRSRRYRQPLRQRQGCAADHQYRHVLHRGAALRGGTTRNRSRTAAEARAATTPASRARFPSARRKSLRPRGIR